MATAPIEALASGDLLGEGPYWDDRAAVLSWVDIKQRRVSTWTPGGTRTHRTLPDEVSLALPCTHGGRVVSQVDRLFLDDGQALTALCAIEPDNKHTRLNDGCCDDLGRLWVGTYSTRGEPEASLYCVTPDGVVTPAITGLTASNGVAWSADGATLFVTDTGRCRIDRYALEHDALVWVGTVMAVDGADGRPDGIALDVEGGLWVAMWGGGQLRRYTADGALTEQVGLPVTYPTSAAFGGADRSTLYVTSARTHLKDPKREPLAGNLLALVPGVSGLPTRRFGR